MLLLPDDIFRDRMTLEDATALRTALESPVQEGPTISWGVISTPATELFGSPSGRAPTSALAAVSYWPQAFDTELLALAVRADPATSYTLRVYVPKLGASPVREIPIDDTDTDVRIDLEDANGNGAIIVPGRTSIVFSVEAAGVGSFTLTPYARRRLRS